MKDVLYNKIGWRGYAKTARNHAKGKERKMKIIGYKKTSKGAVIVEARDIDPNQHLSSAIIERFYSFFNDVPLWGGQEWKTLNVDEVVLIFLEAAESIYQEQKRVYDNAIKEHAERNSLIRWWKKLRGWKAPSAPSRDEIIKSMAKRCQCLSDWMKDNSTRPFYAGSDMNYLIWKPKEVADKLLKG